MNFGEQSHLPANSRPHLRRGTFGQYQGGRTYSFGTEYAAVVEVNANTVMRSYDYFADARSDL